MLDFDVPSVDYTGYSNRLLTGVPMGVLAAALLILSGTFVMTGAPVALGVEFTGGTELRVQTDRSQSELRDTFDQPIESVQRVASSSADSEAGSVYLLTFDSTDVESIRSTAEATDGISVLRSATTSGTFGSSNQRWALAGLGIAFFGMSVIAFVLFRTFVPSLAIVISAFSDIVVPLAIMSVLGIELSLGTVAALLMLIGYSVDSDILLTNQVLRRSGGFYESVDRAMYTGVTMTVTSMAAMAVMAVVATLFRIELMADIGLVLVLGLGTDLLNTYMFNVSLLRWYKYEGVAR